MNTAQRYCECCQIVPVHVYDEYCAYCVEDITAWLYQDNVEYLLQVARKEEDMRYGL